MRRAPRRWIGLDGEGIGRKPHRYVLLCGSDGDGRHESIEDAGGLSSARCLDWLLSWATRDVRLAGYYLSYDWTMMLADLPNASLYRLWRPELRALPRDEGGGFSPVRWRDYKLHYLGGMMRVSRGRHSVTVWDLGKYYQAPFVDACSKWGVLDAGALERVRAMKARRATFGVKDRDDVRAYCALECAALARLATELEAAHAACGLAPKGWYGPGATASVVLARAGIATKRGDIPPAVEDAARRAFFGGRFEQSAQGAFRVTGWDIASAYPFAAFELPCLEHGRWERVTRERDVRRKDVRHAVVRWKLGDVGELPWAPLPARLERGAIVYPRSGARGWAWRDEYLAARGWDGVHFGGEAWTLRGECDCRPFKEVLDLFRARVALGKSGRGIVLKLALNSVYGKLAQTVGAPQYASRVWAGMVTSTTRAMLLGAIATHDDASDVVAVATDGLYTRASWQAPAPPLAPDALGAWEAGDAAEVVFVRPGIYVGPNVVRARGIGRRALEGKHDGLDLRGSHVDLGTRTLFGGGRQTIYRVGSTYHRAPAYGQWRDVPVRVALDPAPKRADDFGLVRLPDVESAPYTRQTASGDGPLAELLREAALLD